MSVTAIVISSLLIASGLLATVIPLIIGAVKKRRVLKPVEYLPPRGASPLDIMIQYYGASANPRDVFNPLMLYWAERGFITIEEDCRRGLKLTKLKDLTPPEGEGYDYNTFRLEQKLFNELFDNNDKFYTLTAYSTFKTAFGKILSECKTEANKVTAVKSRRVKIVSLIVEFLTLVAVILTVGLDIENNIVVTCVFPFVALAFSKGVLSIPEMQGGMEKGSAIRFFMIPFFVMFGGVPFTVVVSMTNLAVALTFSAAFASAIVVIYFLNGKIDIRQDEQLKYYGAICGFKNFLLLAEVKQLNALVEENPRYFYSVLPYCYVLKITKKLKPKFDAIALDGPAWYLGELREILMF